jgi:predicted TIM-barrel fold metal-dependent hydrolase
LRYAPVRVHAPLAILQRKAGTMIIDAWMQPNVDSLAAQPLAERAPAKPGTAEIIAAMDQGHVSIGLLAARCDPTGWAVSHDQVAALVRAHPRRLFGVASADLERPDDAARELRRAVRVHGLRALRLLPQRWGLLPNDLRCYPLYAECQTLGIPLCLRLEADAVPCLDKVAHDFPGLAIVAGPEGPDCVAYLVTLARRNERVHIDTSAWIARDYPPALLRFIGTGGLHQVIFGSNYPAETPAGALQGVGDLGLPEAARLALLGRNAARVFGLERRLELAA